MTEAQGGVPPSVAMFDLITRYWQSQAIGAAAKLGIADALAEGPRSADEIAAARGTAPAATVRLLRVLAALGAVRQVRQDVFALTPLGEMLRSDVPGSMRGFAIAQTSPGHWLPWGRLDDVVRQGRSSSEAALGAELWEYYGAHPEEGVAFSEAMSGMSAMVAGELAASGLVPNGALVADVGGAHGIVLSAVLNADPTARGILYDLPQVVASAGEGMKARGLADRVELRPGDFFADVPEADVHVVKHILHDWDDAQCVRILGNCRKRLRPGGKVIVIEMVLPAEDVLTPARLMDLNMLVMLPGRERTEAEFAALFAAAGLKLTEARPTHSPFVLLEGRAA